MTKLNYVKIIVFGDSISWGKGDNQMGGWVNRLKIGLNLKNPLLEVSDLSVPGDTTKTLLKRLDDEAEARNPQIIIIAIGINDSAYIQTSDKRRVSLMDFKNNVKELVTKARVFTNKILMVSLTPVDETKTRPIYQTTSTYYTNSDIRAYNAVLREVADELNINYVDVYDIISLENLPDGLHIDPLGHEKIFRAVQDRLLRAFEEDLTHFA